MNVRALLAPLLPHLVTVSPLERLRAAGGATIGILIVGIIGMMTMPAGSGPLLIAPLGASAVLLFAVPASPLAQPWSVLGGNTISAFIGVIVAHFVRDPILAIGFGVSIAIAAMSFARCLHPP